MKSDEVLVVAKVAEKTSYILKKPFQRFLLLSKQPVLKGGICRGNSDMAVARPGTRFISGCKSLSPFVSSIFTSREENEVDQSDVFLFTSEVKQTKIKHPPQQQKKSCFLFPDFSIVSRTNVKLLQKYSEI